MGLLGFIFILLAQTSMVFWVVADKVCDTTVAEAFLANKIVPDVVSVPPCALVKLKYQSGVEALCGNELTPTQVKDQPSVSFKAEIGCYYTLLCTDPDAYTETKLVNYEWQHWLVVNIPEDDVSEGEVLSEYLGSGPLETDGFHRYVCIVFKQPGKLNFDEERLNNTSAYGRDEFSTMKFTEKYSLGSPVAGNFYRSLYDDYVPVLYKILGL